MQSIGRADFWGMLLLCSVLSLFAPGTEAEATDAYGGNTGSIGHTDYAGSQECRGCHTQIYDSWWKTRHAYSVLDASEARAAGYPLPPTQGAADPIQRWGDVSFVIGGRQRIAYADRSGQVLDSAYHHRIESWSPFPSKHMKVCGPCHFTGAMEGARTPDETPDPADPGNYHERNVGCEACHGPGARHSESLESEDIRVDASSRVCGRCHTSAGKVLPKDDAHATHDLVQTWNRDPHVLGVRFRSHNAFCSDCHSPYERGDFTEEHEGAAIRVFSEHKQNITCIGCHDPHALTEATYSRDEVYLGPPIAPRPHVYRGNDGDFTTTDYDSFQSTEQVCLDCHRGADRVDLDHANATCNDCHNTFNRNRMPESRPFNDANHGRLSCRPCHQNADHLLSIVFRDADFLAPRNVHNLRTLPQTVIARYGFKYPATRSKRWAALPADPGGLTVAAEMSVASLRARHADRDAASSAPTRALVESPLHIELAAAHPQLQELQQTLLSEPSSLANLLALARGYAQRGATAAAREVLELSSDGAAAVFRPLFFSAGARRPALGPGAQSSALPNPSTNDPEAELTTLLFNGLLDLGQGRFAEAAETFPRASSLAPNDAHIGLHLGLAQLGQRQPAAAIETLEANVAAHTAHIASRIALAAIYVNYDRLEGARQHLNAAMASDPEHALAAYFLGRAQLRLRNPMDAAAAFRTTLMAHPDDLNAWFHLARAYRAAKFYGAAVDTYDEIIRRQPGLFDAHHDLALLYKLLSDKVDMTHKREAEKARPVGIGKGEWRRYLAQLERRAVEYAERALVAFDHAGTLRSLDAEATRQVAELLRRAGRLGEARQKFESLAQIEPTQWVHRYRLGTIAIRQGEHANAIDYLEGALALAPSEGDVYVALALAYARSGRIDQAISTLERGAVDEPFNPALFTNLGAAYAVRGDYARAQRVLERALKLRTFPLPRTHLAHVNLAIVHLREGRRGAAQDALEHALHVYPDYAYAQQLLAKARSAEAIAPAAASPVYDDLLERFGEISTVQFPNE